MYVGRNHQKQKEIEKGILKQQNHLHKLTQ